MKSRSVLCVVVCFVAASASHLQAQERSRAEAYALEGLGALPGIAGCGCLGMGFVIAGFWADFGMDNPGQNPRAVAVAYSLALVSAAALPAAAGYGTVRVGEELIEDGSKGWAFGGAYAGALALGSLGFLYRQVGGAFIGSAAGSMAGAVVGYNLGAVRAPGPYQPGFGGRFWSPGVALTSIELPDHSVEYGLKVQLAGLRF